MCVNGSLCLANFSHKSTSSVHKVVSVTEPCLPGKENKIYTSVLFILFYFFFSVLFIKPTKQKFWLS